MEVAIETMADVAGDVVALVTGFISYEVVEEVAEGMIDVIPKYGLCVGVLRLVWGLVYAAIGAMIPDVYWVRVRPEL